MSSNAFARSRPRVRHQRVPKTQCYAHPRFLQLVKELTRLDDEKKKQEQPGHSGSKGDSSSHKANIAGNFTSNACNSSDDCSDSTPTPNQPQIVAHQRQPHHHHHHHHHNHHNHQSSSQQQQAHQQHQNSHHHQQQHSSIDCWPSTNSLAGANCCNINDAHSSNGCRSIECMQSTSALNNNYYRQNNDYLIGTIYNQMHRQHSYPSNQQQHDASINNHLSHHHNHHQPQHQDNRCPPKCTTSSAASSSNANNDFGYSKASLIEQHSTTNQSNSDPGARQDENRTKRKRSSNDSTNCGKKIISSSPSSPSSCSKRHKSSPEPARPLSPSFTKCPICLLDCMNRDPSFTNTCFHLFCFVCIENWSKSKATCPLCRTKFSKIIYNISSASCFDEKIASPIRREDDDDRIIYEQLHGLNANNLDPRRTTTTSRNDDTRMLFDNLSPGDVLMPHFALLNHSLNRHVSALHSFNSVTSNSDFNLNVPNGFAAPVYNHAGSNYIALIPNDRSQAAANNPAITSAYTPNTSLTNISSDSSNRLPRISRSGRFLYSRNYDLSTTDGSARVSRATNTDSTQTGISLEPRHQMHFNNNHHHSQHTQHPPQQHRSTVATIEVGPRQSQRVGPPSHLPYLGPFRPYTNPFVPRRPEGPAEQHILNNLYHQMPDI